MNMENVSIYSSQQCFAVFNVQISYLLGASLIAQSVKSLPTMQETQVQFLGGEDPLENEMATQYSYLENPIDRGAWQGLQELDTTERLSTHLAFTSSFLTWMPFLSFAGIIALAGTSSTVLSREGESRHPCFVPYYRGKVFSLWPLSVMLTVGVSYMAFIMFR